MRKSGQVMEQVFVYGTLKRGEPNHSWLTTTKNGTAKYVGDGRTETKYPLVIGTRYNIPFLLDAPGVGHNVEGEIYEVNEDMLKNLDILEDYPTFYTRRKENITSELDTKLMCWTYFLNKFKPEMTKLEMYANYSAMGPHNKPYNVRELRDPSSDYMRDVKEE